MYTNGPDVQTHVHAEVLDPETGIRETTNDFQFTFDTGLPNLPRVMPKTYAGSNCKRCRNGLSVKIVFKFVFRQ